MGLGSDVMAFIALIACSNPNPSIGRNDRLLFRLMSHYRPHGKIWNDHFVCVDVWNLWEGPPWR